jgi:hypothetical protein
MTWSFGATGRPARREISSTMATPAGNWARVTGLALYMASTMRGLTRRMRSIEIVPKIKA